MSYHCGIDIGGAFTDCVVIDEGGRIITAKAPSTPHDFSQGFLESIRLAAEQLGLAAEELLRRTSRLAHGTTVDPRHRAAGGRRARREADPSRTPPPRLKCLVSQCAVPQRAGAGGAERRC